MKTHPHEHTSHLFIPVRVYTLCHNPNKSAALQLSGVRVIALARSGKMNAYSLKHACTHTHTHTHDSARRCDHVSGREVVRYQQWLPHTKRNAAHKTSGAGRDVTWSNIMSSCSGAGNEGGGCFIHLMPHTAQYTMTWVVSLSLMYEQQGLICVGTGSWTSQIGTDTCLIWSDISICHVFCHFYF